MPFDFTAAIVRERIAFDTLSAILKTSCSEFGNKSAEEYNAKTMTNDEIQSLERDFLAWTGGFEPESTFQITTYLDYACAPALSREQVREFLIAWMNHPDSTAAIRSE